MAAHREPKRAVEARPVATQLLLRAARAAALAAPGRAGESVFAELARCLATMLHCEAAFVARLANTSPPSLTMLAIVQDGELRSGFDCPLAGSPFGAVLGQPFRAYPRALRQRFPDDLDVQMLRLEGLAGVPLNAPDGGPIGVLAVGSRRPLARLERFEAVLKTFAMRAAAEIERLNADEALKRSEAGYRAIFEAAEEAILIHDWDTGTVLDINPKACETYGYAPDEFRRLSADEFNAGVAPYAGGETTSFLQLAKLGRCPPIEWQRREPDGSVRWDELRLKPAAIDGRRRILAFGRDITEYKTALADLQAQEKKYRAIFDGSIDSMVLWSDDLRVVDINEAFVRMTGLRRDQVLGRHWTERPDAHDVEGLLGLIHGALEGRVGSATTTVTRADGSPFEIELRYLPVPLGDRRFALGVGRDVSERLESERALQRSEAQYRGIFNASADALVLRDAEFRIVDVNATYERMSGYARDEVLGVDRVLANPPEVMQRIRALHARALAGEPVTLETQLVRRDGQRYELELRGVPIQHRGEPHVLYIGRDITVAKRARQALRDSEEQYRAMFNASADGLLLRDADFRIVEVNPAYLAMTGYEREELLGAARVLTQSAAENEACVAAHARVLAGDPLRLEAIETRKDGSTFASEVRGMPVVYRGQPHVLYVSRDITERRQADAERTELEQRLRQAQKMEAIGQLTGGIAHDFNNILTSIIGYLVLGLERVERLGDATLLRQLGQAHLAARRASDLIAQMLAFARRQRGERRSLQLAPLVHQTLQLLRPTLPSSLAVDFSEPTAGDDLLVSADAVQLEQVLFNLCINARDAITGIGTIRVRQARRNGAWHCASCRAGGETGRWAELSVTDSGSGIAPDLLDRIFEPFVSNKEVGRGSGMGLAMVHGIVHDHGGHIEVETTPGRGSTFRVLLPTVDDAQPRDPAARAPAAERSAPPLRGRVLVVDDEAMVGDFMAELLGNWGLEVVLHRDPLQALAWLEEPSHQADLVITDQTMPHLTGMALARRAVALRPGLPILLYSGNAEGLDAADLQTCGVCGVLRKPVEPEALRALLRGCLESRGARSAR